MVRGKDKYQNAGWFRTADSHNASFIKSAQAIDFRQRSTRRLNKSRERDRLGIWVLGQRSFDGTHEVHWRSVEIDRDASLDDNIPPSCSMHYKSLAIAYGNAWVGLALPTFYSSFSYAHELLAIPEADEQDNIDYPENALNHSIQDYSCTKSLQVFEEKYSTIELC